jgi:hypothetical protein
MKKTLSSRQPVTGLQKARQDLVAQDVIDAFERARAAVAGQIMSADELTCFCAGVLFGVGVYDFSVRVLPAMNNANGYEVVLELMLNAGDSIVVMTIK